MSTNEEKKEQYHQYLKEAYIPIGLFGFSLSTFLLSFLQSKVFGAYDSSVSFNWAELFILMVALIFGGGVQLLAGFKTIKHGHVKTGSVLSMFGVFWIILSLFKFIYLLTPITNTQMEANSKSEHNPYSYLLIAQGAFMYFYLFISAFSLYVSIFKDRTTSLIFLALVLAFFFFGTAAIVQGSTLPWDNATTKEHAGSVLNIVGGVFGIIAAIGAFYLGWAIVLRMTFNRAVIPVGLPLIKAKK